MIPSTGYLVKMALILSAAAIGLLVMIARHIALFSTDWYVDALLHREAPFWETSFWFYAQMPMVVIAVLAIVFWARVGWRIVALHHERARERASAGA